MARAYVCLDRAAYVLLQGTPQLQDLFARMKQHLQEQDALRDFQRLAEARAEAEEILWLLGGCQGLPGFIDTQELFGSNARKLSEELDTIKKAAKIIETFRYSPFGQLLSAVAFPFGSKMTTDLQIYVALAKMAQRAFSHGSEWFLNLAKARLVIHVMHWTESPHDKEVSCLVAAVASIKRRKVPADKEFIYSEEAQCRWRHQHSELIDPRLDPYTVQTEAERHNGWGLLKELTVTDLELAQPLRTWAGNFAKISQSRLPQPPNR